MYRFITAMLTTAGFALPLLAQESGPAELQKELVKHWTTSKKYVLALADQMPAGDYAFKPNKEQMSFGEQLAHIAGSNGFFFSKLSGKKDPIAKPANFEKATVVKMLNDSYDFVIASLQDMDFSRFHETFDAEGEKMSGLELFLLATDHTAHHRGQCVAYLRAKNIKPAEYEF